MKEEQISFKNRDKRLYGMLHIPQPESRREGGEGVLILHGFAGNSIGPHRIFVKVARRLQKRGKVVLRFDFCGCGQSEGEMKDADFIGQFSDAQRAIDFLIDKTGIDEITLIGFSMGALVACYLARRYPSLIKKIVFWSACLSLERAKDNLLKSVYPLGDGLWDMSGNCLNSKMWHKLSEINPLRQISHRTSIDALVIYHKKDELILPKDSEDLYNVLRQKGGRVERFILDDQREYTYHSFSSVVTEKLVIDKTIEFICA